MGFDLARFQDDVDEELICPICTAVLQDPVQEPVPRILRNLLGRLLVRCVNARHGCEAVVRLEILAQHEEDCEANPSRPVHCERGCGLSIPCDEEEAHNCVAALRDLVDTQRSRLDDLETRISNQAAYISTQAQEIRTLKNAVQNLSFASTPTSWAEIPSSSNPVALDSLNMSEANLVRDYLLQLNESGASSAVAAPSSSEDVPRTAEWARTLPRARVSHWGRLISTPDTVLQTVIKRALVDSGCPGAVAEELMNRSDERGWPPGLRSLEMRQLNRSSFSRFLCRRLPGSQAVLLLSCENTELPSHLSLHSPGIIMIFANGVDNLGH